MSLINLLRAKSEKGSEDKNLLLKDHIVETLKRARQLKDFVEANGGTITYPHLKEEKFFTALALALIIHDFGKINYDFQKKVYNRESDDWNQLKEFLNPLMGIGVRHEILSTIWASILLDDNTHSDWKDWFSKIRTAILLHHYNRYYIEEKDLMEIVQNSFEDVRKYVKFIVDNSHEFEIFLNDLMNRIHEKFANDDFIKSAIEIIGDFKLERAKTLLEMIENREDDISEFAEFYEVDNEYKIDNKNPNYDFLVFLGCLRRCDYSSSGEVSIESCRDLSGFFSIIEDNVNTLIGRMSRDTFWQKEVLEKEVNGNDSLILIAPTGSGKTEFALLWAAKNKRKLIYTLPLRVALNDLYSRFLSYSRNEGVDLLHSTSFMEYLERTRSIDIDKQLTSAKILSSPVLLSTPDQVFLTALNYYGCDKTISVYPLSSIVIDEIQAYNPEMAAIIIKTLDIVRSLNGNILVMTATLPPYFREFFRDFKNIDVSSYSSKVKNYNLKRHVIEVKEFSGEGDDYVIRYTKDNNKSKIEVNINLLLNLIEYFRNKNLFIVFNNVSKAIKAYEELLNNYKDANIFLLHSRLIEKEKNDRISKIKSLLNNEKIENLDPGKPIIVVSTQIIEASVDLDFDAMITEISPIDSQIQRWGRIHRNRERDYQGRDPNIIVIAESVKEGKLKPDIGTSRIYDRTVTEKTFEVLKEYQKKGCLDYEMEREMIEKVFEMSVEVEDEDIIRKTGRTTVSLREYYVEKIKQTKNFLKYFSVEKKSQAQKLFRNIAGIQVVIPEIMKKVEELKKFAEIVEDFEKSSLPWKDILELLGEETDNEKERELKKWKLKKILYDYSVNVPIFLYERLYEKISHEFKGFSVLRLKSADAEKVKEFGLDYLFLQGDYEEEDQFL